MSNEQVYEHAESTYGSDSFQQIHSRANKKRRPPQAGRRGKSPESFNGMHRRRRKKVAW
jgi:hypothetical protein